MAQIDSVQLYIKRVASQPGYHFNVNVRAATSTYSTNPGTGTVLGSKSILYDDIPTGTPGWVTFTFDTPITISETGWYGVQFTTDTNYAMTSIYWYTASDFGYDVSPPHTGEERSWHYNGSAWVADVYWYTYRVNCTGVDSNVAETPTEITHQCSYADPGVGIRVYLEPAGTLGKATNPSPANSATGVSLNLDTLSWTAATGTPDGYNVYLSWWGSTSTLYTVGTTITISDWVPLYADRFSYSDMYTWRVDSVKEGEDTVTGDTWSFTTRTFDRVWPTARDTSGNITTTDVAYYTGENFICGNTARLVAASGNAIWYEGVDSA
jgi:hypothetical protein